MEVQNQNTKGGCLKIALIAIGIIILIGCLFPIGWIGGIIWLLCFRKRLNGDPQKQKLVTIAVSVLSVFSFIFMIYFFATGSQLKSIKISSDVSGQELEIDQDYIINIECFPTNAKLSTFTYNMDGSCATFNGSNADEKKAILHTTAEGKVIISVSNGDINSNSLEFTIVDKGIEEPSKKNEDNTKESSTKTSEDKDTDKSSDNEKSKAVADKPAEDEKESNKTEDSNNNSKEESDKFPKTIADDIDVVFSESVPKDVTGKWRLACVATEKEIQTYALEYYNSYFQSDDEIHAIVNDSLKTTNKLAKISSDILDIAIYEYVDKEENDAKILFTGTLLANYQVNIPTGEVTQIPSEVEEDNTTDGDASGTSNTDSSENPPETPAAPEPVEPAPDMVWIDDTGKKYHAKSSCSNMSDPYQVPRSEAEAMGRDACKKCY